MPAKRWERAEVSASRSLGAILRLSKKSRTYPRRASNSGPDSSALTSGPFSVPSNRLTCLVILPPMNSATSSKSFLVSSLNLVTSAGITVDGFKLLKKACNGFIGALASPINIILARSGSTIGSIGSFAAGALVFSAVKPNSVGVVSRVRLVFSSGSVKSKPCWLGALRDVALGSSLRAASSE